MTWIDFVGYLAALTVLATFCMDTIVPLRGLAIASNVLFIMRYLLLVRCVRRPTHLRWCRSALQREA